MNSKLIELWKKFTKFLGVNWIAIVIIGGLLIMSGTCSKIASNKIAKKDAQISELNKKNKDLQGEIDKNKEEYILLDDQYKAILDRIKELELKNETLEANKKKIEKKYADLYEKFGKLSQAEQDKLLVELLAKYEITAEVRDNSLVITMTDRNKLYTFIVDIDKVKEELANSNEGWVTCRATVEEQGAVIMNREEKLKLKDSDIAKLNEIIENKDKIIKNQKDKIFWTKVSSFSKKAIPALILGLVLGYVVGK